MIFFVVLWKEIRKVSSCWSRMISFLIANRSATNYSEAAKRMFCVIAFIWNALENTKFFDDFISSSFRPSLSLLRTKRYFGHRFAKYPNNMFPFPVTFFFWSHGQYVSDKFWDQTKHSRLPKEALLISQGQKRKPKRVQIDFQTLDMTQFGKMNIFL